MLALRRRFSKDEQNSAADFSLEREYFDAALEELQHRRR
jgi:hypothetical protein